MAIISISQDVLVTLLDYSKDTGDFYGKGIELGKFDCPKKAHEKYIDAKRSHHAGCTI